MKKIFHITYSFALVLLVCFGVLPVTYAASVDPPVPPIMISELQTEGPAGKYEFIELYNSGPTKELNSWRLEYLSATHGGGPVPTRVLATINGEFLSSTFILISQQEQYPGADVVLAGASTNLLARSGGHIRLIDGQGNIVDQLSWGTATAQGQWPKVPEIVPAMSVQRILPGESLFTTGFTYHSGTENTTAASGGLQVIPNELPACQALQVTEILPNPSGVDEGREFIELYNPTSEIMPLKGCWLRLGKTGTQFALPDEPILPGAYRMFTDSQTGLKLPNATAQSVWLLFDEAPLEGQEFIYGDMIPEDVAWAVFDKSWQMTYTPTPAAANVLTSRRVPVQTAEAEPLSCPAGKERNAETNRCRTIPQVDGGQAACKEGQERSSETGRCRMVGRPAVASACQERNPETNRCRSVLAASVAPKLCPQGQERNPETNRCRKIQSAAQLAVVHDVGSSNIPPKQWWLGGLAVLIIGGYAVYEWRHDLVLAWQRRRARRPSSRSSATNSSLRGSGDKIRKSVL